MNDKKVDIVFAIIVFAMCTVLALWSTLVTYAVVQIDRKLNDLQASYELTDQELLDLEDELNYKGYINGKKKD